jgi:WhiB family redox-sensing transcriptional regulator
MAHPVSPINREDANVSRGVKVLDLIPRSQGHLDEMDDLHHRYLPEWTKRAACAGRDTQDWFPEDRKSVAEEVQSSWLAKRICSTCPVRAECLEQAFVMGDDHGIFGGATPGQRRKVAHDPDRVYLLLSELEIEMWADDREVIAV